MNAIHLFAKYDGRKHRVRVHSRMQFECSLRELGFWFGRVLRFNYGCTRWCQCKWFGIAW